jgi:hypothetical protein
LRVRLHRRYPMRVRGIVASKARPPAIVLASLLASLLAVCGAGCGASTRSPSSGAHQLAPAYVPCGFRAVVHDEFALALPELWQEAPTKGDGMAFAAVGPQTQVWLDSTTWNGDSKTFARRVVGAMTKHGDFDYVEHHWVTLGGEEALFVESRRAETDKGRYWHEWQLLGAFDGRGWELMCRTDESTADVVRPTCEVVLNSLVME